MIGDRDYMREEPSHRMPMTLTAILTITLVVCYALQCINDVYLDPQIEFRLALTVLCFKAGWLWQLITFQFLHGNLWHVFGNLLVLWWAGRFCESVLGKSRFLVAYFGCGVAGGILQGLLMLAFPMHYGMFVVGASAGVTGLLAIFCLLNRDRQILLFFVLPVRAMVLLYFVGGISLFFTLVPTPRENVAHAAHLGGLLAGMAWVKLGWHRDFVRLPWERLLDAWRERRSRRPIRMPRGLKRTATAAAAERSSEAAKQIGPTEFISKEVDPILDKIAAHGIHSLTDEEKKILASARARMERR